jgi:hypothetical protein
VDPRKREDLVHPWMGVEEEGHNHRKDEKKSGGGPPRRPTTACSGCSLIDPHRIVAPRTIGGRRFILPFVPHTTVSMISMISMIRPYRYTSSCRSRILVLESSWHPHHHRPQQGSSFVVDFRYHCCSMALHLFRRTRGAPIR